MKEFFAHSLILSARSTYFKTALSKERERKENGIIIVKEPNISPEIIELILKYLYTGTINFDKQNVTQLLKLFSAAEELSLQKLYDYIETYLIDNQVVRNNPVEFIQFAYHQYEVKNV
jgi:hypothetical protein